MAPDPDQNRLREINRKLMQLREEHARIGAERKTLRSERDELMGRLGKVKKVKEAAEA